MTFFRNLEIQIEYFRFHIKNPFNKFRNVCFQSAILIQPVIFRESGRQNMCDEFPDITVWKDELVWSYRLEEPKIFGCFVWTVP